MFGIYIMHLPHESGKTTENEEETFQIQNIESWIWTSSVRVSIIVQRN